MSATARAIVNRENAQSSTGPKTETGKAASRMNALGHGLTSTTVVLPHENPEAYRAMHRGLVEAHKPANANEAVLVEHVAHAYWRLQRCYAIESAFLENCIAASEEHPEAAMANLFIDKAESSRMRLLMRYLGSAERAYNKALADLHKAQAERRKQEQEDAAVQAMADLYSDPRPAEKPDGFVSHLLARDFASVVTACSVGS
jgi:hypothetical protein